MYDLSKGQEWTLGRSVAQDEASVVKVNILEALLAKSGNLSTSEQSLARTMIENSTNTAATHLWDDAGSTSGIASFDASAGLSATTPSGCITCPGFPWPGWGLTTTTPSDQITLLRLLVGPNQLLSSAERSEALTLMEHITPSEAWGISAGVPAGAKLALKNGWLPLNISDTDWQVNSIGWVDGTGATT